ncbi:MAG: polysaccharide deacetylase family protein [Caulobacterales bacterium]|nr:polysaccharide deacetylase family protein [Caulobacterales bacterium]
MTAAYAPARDPASKLRRRLTQWRAARPADLRFDAPMLSISFDDFPVSAATTGAAILEAHGARATFYASAGLAGADGPSGRNFSADDLRRLAAAGHEIGCHTHAHADCARRGVFDTLQDLAKNRDGLHAMGFGGITRTIAYPYGETSSALKANLPPRFECARGILPGINQGRADLAQLRAFPMFGANGLARLHNALKRAAKRKAWVIGFTHDVSDTPSAFGTSSADLQELLRTAHQLGFTILPVGAALSRRLT